MKTARREKRFQHGMVKHNFYRKVEIDPSGCLIWVGAKDPTGYGNTYYRGRVIKAHRLSLLIHNGGLTKGLVIDHLCRNRSCVNPTHLEEVTQRENLHRGEGNPSKTHCPQGHEYSGYNVYWYKGHRHCRTCSIARSKAWRSAQRNN